ncbi:MAG: GuaB1 family IMP dehydrogenase-related protein [Sandaracinaceae bacterium]|nr:GuaB1 family IMP dehydrogenase-related protein [Sandaracinaceae bacterium]
MRFLHPERDERLELALEDVFLVPQRFDGLSRLEVNLTPQDFPGGSHPVVTANMNAVTGKRMAETVARFGGLGVLPQDMSLETVERIVRHIKAADPRYDTPLSVSPDATLRDVEGILRKRAHHMVVVVDDARRPVGVVTPADLRDRDQYSAVRHFMQRGVVTIPTGTSNHDGFLVMERERLKAVPVIDEAGQLAGILTRDDAVRLELLSASVNARGELMVAAAVGISSEAAARAGALRELGVDALVLDTAHGHQRRMTEALRAVRADCRLPLIAGNVCTAEGTRELIEAGADVVKVNVGPGAMCTTRMQTGVGRPTFSAVRACAAEARRLGKHVWADGGVRHPRDVALYCAAGAARVMVGTMLAGTFESPGDVLVDAEGRIYKQNYGMASARAVAERTAGLDAFERAKKGFFREGISTSRIYIQPGRESVGAILVDFITGLSSALTYVGAQDLEELHARAVVGVQTASGFGEGTPHGRVVG